MSLRLIDVNKVFPEIEWCVQDLVPCGYVTIIASREGTGKTALLTFLIWQMTRPAGDFLGRSILRGRSLFLNTDASDGESRSIRILLQRHQSAFPDGNINDISIFEMDSSEISHLEIEQLIRICREIKPQVIVIDSMMASFPTKNQNKASEVMPIMQLLRNLASETGAAVVVTDHLPKSTQWETSASRGPIGSIAKSAQSRSTLILHEVLSNDSKEKLLCLGTRKSSFSISNQAIYFKFHWYNDPPSVDVELLEPPISNSSRSALAKIAIVSHLQRHPDETILHRDLVGLAMTTANLQPRSAQAAVRLAVAELASDLITAELPEPGSPKMYRYIARNHSQDVSHEENFVALVPTTNDNSVI